MVALGDAAFAAGDWKGAETWFGGVAGDQSVAKDDGASEVLQDAFLKLGLSVHRQGRAEQALAIYDHLLSAFPKTRHATQAAFERGQALLDLKRDDDAAACFVRVLKDEEGADKPKFSVFAKRHMAAIASRQGRSEEAARLLGEVAAATDDASGAARLRLDQGLALLGAGQFAEAEAALEESAKADAKGPVGAEARANLGIAVSRQGKAPGSAQAAGVIAVERRFAPRIDAREHRLRAGVGPPATGARRRRGERLPGVPLEVPVGPSRNPRGHRGRPAPCQGRALFRMPPIRRRRPEKRRGRRRRHAHGDRRPRPVSPRALRVPDRQARPGRAHAHDAPEGSRRLPHCGRPPRSSAARRCSRPTSRRKRPGCSRKSRAWRRTRRWPPPRCCASARRAPRARTGPGASRRSRSSSPGSPIHPSGSRRSSGSAGPARTRTATTPRSSRTARSSASTKGRQRRGRSSRSASACSR